MSNVLEMPGVSKEKVITEQDRTDAARKDEREEGISLRTKGIRIAVEMILDNSCMWSNEIEIALAGLPKKEREEFVRMAAEAVMHIGGYIAWAARVYGR